VNAQDLIDLKTKYETAVSKHGKKALAQLFKEFFEAAPEVDAVKWTQYTPHFNDGDACTFSVHEFEYVLEEEAAATKAQAAEEGREVDDEDDTEGVSSYSLKGKLKKSAESLEEQTSGLEDLFLGAFDDHVKVTATRDGEFNTQEYSHD
jgi:predicted SnoaL-like aldol condensation-catalyzing enzyme